MSVVANASSDEFKELVRARTDIVRLIEEKITLTPKGRIFVGLCPFHEDHKPSFNVNPERQTYICWACQNSGDCFAYVMKTDNLTFPETLEFLSRRAGLEMPARMRRGTESKDKPQIYDVLEWAKNEFHECLLSTAIAERARKYLQSRGFNHDSISKFKLGFHPESWDWLIQRAKGKFDLDLMVQSSLAKKRDDGSGYYDQFIDRVMFPIHDERGRCVAFGGRILPDSTTMSRDAKYLNSNETPVFSKSRLCYALHVARDAIKKTGTVLVMEGYADCVKAHQGGIHNAVATLGTALTESHVTILKRLARKVVLVFDGDKAGIDAAEKAIPKFLAQDVDLRILTVPDELDPDEYVDQRGGAALLQLAEQAPEAFEYQTRLLISRFGTRTIDERQRVLDGMLNLIAIAPGIAGTVKEDLLLRPLPARLGLTELDVRRRLKQVRADQSVQASRASERKVNAGVPSVDVEQLRRKQSVDSLQRSASNDEKLECELLQLLFTHPDMIHAVRREIGPDDFRHEALREILSTGFDLLEHGVEPTYERLLSKMECPEQKRLMVWIEELSPHRADAKSLDGAGRVGMESASDGLQRVIKALKWRRTSATYQASKSLLVERPSDPAKLTTESRQLLEQAARFHRERTAK